MRSFRKTVTAALATALLLWYGLPSVQRVLYDGIPESAAGVALYADGAEPVRGTTDERLLQSEATEYTAWLFGLVPLRTLHAEQTGVTLAASGRVIGIRMQTRGVQIVGFGGIRLDSGTAHPAADAGLMAGDEVLTVNGEPTASNADFLRLCNTDELLVLRGVRDGEPFSVTVTPVMDEDGTYRIGAWVRDSTSGLGTLSFYDPVTLRYAALGHGVSDVDTGVLFSNGGGEIYPATVTAIRRASGTEAGELIGTFPTEDGAALGTLTDNTVFGIAGRLYGADDAVSYPLGESARFGEATMLCTADGDSVQAYSVRVIRLDVHASSETNGMMIEVTDRDLLSRTGGIVQGMSGSPVLQDGKLVGVVTHVFLNDSTRGYCIYASQMYEKLLRMD